MFRTTTQDRAQCENFNLASLDFTKTKTHWFSENEDNAKKTREMLQFINTGNDVTYVAPYTMAGFLFISLDKGMFSKTYRFRL